MNSKTNNQFPNEKVIDIKELCWRLLEQWRMIVIFAILVAAIFLGYTHFQKTQASNNKAQQDIKKLSAEEIINTLPENKRAVVAGAYRLLLEREQLAQYIQSAPFMQLDPSHMDCLRLSWSVSGDEAIKKALIQAYATTFQTNECINTIIECCKDQLNSAQVSDLISVIYPSEEGQDIFCCDIYLTNGMDVDLLQEKLDQIIYDASTRFQKEYGPHQIVDLRSERISVSDDEALQKQTTVLNSFANSNNQINSLKTTFSSEQRDAFSRLEALNNGQETTVQDDMPQKTLTVHNVLLGIILGLILYLLGFLLHAIVTKKMLYANEIPDSSLHRLGEWYSDCSDLKKGAVIQDRFVKKKHHSAHLDKEDEIEKSLKRIDKICEQNAINKVLFISTAHRSKEQDEFISNIIAQCVSSGIVADCTELNRNDYEIADSLLFNTDGVVLCLIQDNTNLKDIEYVFNKCNDCNKTIIGSVYLG